MVFSFPFRYGGWVVGDLDVDIGLKSNKKDEDSEEEDLYF